MIQRLYHNILLYSDRPWAFWVYLLVCFSESSFFPLPPDLMMVPMIIAKRDLAWRLALWGTIASVLGGILGYGIGAVLFKTVGMKVIEFYHLESSFAAFKESFAHYGAWIIVLKGLTPIPYKLVTIASGVAQFDFKTFILASCVCRGFRFFMLAGLFWWAGPTLKPLIERYLNLFLIASLGIIVLGFALFKLL
jgi:membrane protein YqaA with SNARE-associated domain